MTPEPAWKDDPNYLDWVYAVANFETRLGFFEWVEHEFETKGSM